MKKLCPWLRGDLGAKRRAIYKDLRKPFVLQSGYELPGKGRFRAIRICMKITIDSETGDYEVELEKTKEEEPEEADVS